MLKIYVDATCEWWNKTDGKAWGKILVYYPVKEKIREREFFIENPKLKQFINRFELEAILWADILYKKKIIYSDSSIAVGWAIKEGINVEWLPREDNLAGQILEEQKQHIETSANSPYKYLPVPPSVFLKRKPTTYSL